MPIFTAPSSFPVGSIVPYSTTNAPDANWLICDGSAVSRTTYATLFALVGTSFGSGDGSTTFNLPDFRGRMPVGKGTHADVSTIGNNDGIALANRKVKHFHTFPTPVSTGDAQGGAGGVVPFNGFSGTSNTSGTGGPQDSPSYLVVQYLIRAL